MKLIVSDVKQDNNYRSVLVNKEIFVCNKIGESIESPGDVAAIMTELFELDQKAEEYLYLLCLTNENRPIYIFEVAHGTYNMCHASGREVFTRALLCGTCRFILIHNHPSGNVDPSKDDVLFTEKIDTISKMLDIDFLDHIIIGKACYYCFSGNEILYSSDSN